MMTIVALMKTRDPLSAATIVFTTTGTLDVDSHFFLTSKHCHPALPVCPYHHMPYCTGRMRRTSQTLSGLRSRPARWLMISQMWTLERRNSWRCGIIMSNITRQYSFIENVSIILTIILFLSRFVGDCQMPQALSMFLDSRGQDVIQKNLFRY